MAQWNKTTQDFLNQERSLFETYNIADHWGNQTDWRPNFSDSNRLKLFSMAKNLMYGMKD
jgi:hypothetical protein